MTEFTQSTVYLQGHAKRGLDKAHNRLFYLMVLIAFVFLVMVIRTLELGTSDVSGHGQELADIQVKEFVPERRDISDRTGEVMAATLSTRSLWVNPSRIKDPDEAAAKIVMALPDLNVNRVRTLLASDAQHRVLKKRVTPAEAWRVNALGIPALGFSEETERIYPQGSLASHILGMVGSDGGGRGGVEQYFNTQLADQTRAASAFQLSIDLRVQHAMRASLLEAMRAHQALGAAGLMMDVRTGEVVALVSLPDFDPNYLNEALQAGQQNRITYGLFEPGSTFKTFTFAASFEEGMVGFSDGYDATLPIKAGRFRIRDDHPKGRYLSIPEIFIYSSNIGTSHMVRDLGIEKQRVFLDQLGLLEKASLEIIELRSPMTPLKWGDVESMTVSYGHGIAITPLHLVRSVAGIMNDGWMHTPTLLANPMLAQAGKRVVSAQTSRKIRQLYRLTVTHGTARQANARGYRVGGKTGTAEKVKEDGSGYDQDRLVASFIGVFPIDDPAYAVFAMLDEPKGNRATQNFRSGGWTAAPVVRTVIKRTAPILGIAPKIEDDSLYQNAIAHLVLPPNKTKSR